MPGQWNNLLGNGETFIQAPGHAEQTIVNALGNDWVITSGGSSRNVCIPTCQPLLEGQGLQLGGPTFPGMADKTPYRMFWRHTMSYPTEITHGIEDLDKWQQVALAGMCAASVWPVVARFAHPATRRAFDQGLNAVWKSARDAAPDVSVVAARALLDDLAESTCDDSNVPAYEVMVALGVLAYALNAVVDADSTCWAQDACTAATSHYSGFDNVLAQGNQPRRIDPRNPPARARLESLQVQSQLRSITAMRNVSQVPSGIVEQMQASAAQLASELDRVVPAYAKQRSWGMERDRSGFGNIDNAWRDKGDKSH